MIGTNSRFRRSTLLVMLDSRGRAIRRPYLDRWPRLPNVVFPDNSEYKPVDGDSFTSLAYRYYGDSRLWWVIAEFNRVVDPYSEMRSFIEGAKTIVIPSLSRVQFDILAFNANSFRA